MFETFKDALENIVYRGWEKFLQENVPVLSLLNKNLNKFIEKGEVYVPFNEKILNALSYCKPKKIKVIILGQDPYPGLEKDGLPTAQGLAFSVPKGARVPASLKNIFKEIKAESTKYPECPGLENYEIPSHGDLEEWCKQGVFLINTSLTCRLGAPDSHKNLWKSFMIPLFKYIVRSSPDVIFVLWGSRAQNFFEELDLKVPGKNILKSPHPSPLSAEKGFFGNEHFYKINQILISNRKRPIYW